MILSDRTILMLVRSKALGIEPFRPEQVQPASYDLTMGEVFQVPQPSPDVVTSPQDIQYQRFHGAIVIPPKGFMLAATAERVRLPAGVSAQVSGRSTLGRMGLAVHITAGFIDPGFDGHITLELFNHSPRAILLKPGMPAGQLVFSFLDAPARNPYAGRYQGALGVETPKNFVANDDAQRVLLEESTHLGVL